MHGLEPADREGRVQKLVDRLLTLYLYNRVSERSKMWGDTKLQKLVFLSEKKMIENQRDGYHYRFFRYDLGPLSTELYTDHDFLQENELVSTGTNSITERGEHILHEVGELLEENEQFLSDIDSVVDEYGELSGSQLKNIVYDVEVSPLTGEETLRVEDIPKHRDILFQLPEHVAEESFETDEGWLETLDILFHPPSRQKLNQSISKAKEQPSIPFDH